MERFLKVNFNGADPDGLSAIRPEVYRDRLVDILDRFLLLFSTSLLYSGPVRSDSFAKSKTYWISKT